MRLSLKKCISLFLFLTFVSLQAEVKNIRLKLPVRVFSPQDKTIQLTKNDFVLYVNGKLTPIFDVLNKEKSLHIKPDLGRNSIFLFRTYPGCQGQNRTGLTTPPRLPSGFAGKSAAASLSSEF